MFISCTILCTCDPVHGARGGPLLWKAYSQAYIIEMKKPIYIARIGLVFPAEGTFFYRTQAQHYIVNVIFSIITYAILFLWRGNIHIYIYFSKFSNSITIYQKLKMLATVFWLFIYYKIIFKLYKLSVHADIHLNFESACSSLKSYPKLCLLGYAENNFPFAFHLDTKRPSIAIRHLSL